MQPVCLALVESGLHLLLGHTAHGIREAWDRLGFGTAHEGVICNDPGLEAVSYTVCFAFRDSGYSSLKGVIGS